MTKRRGTTNSILKSACSECERTFMLGHLSTDDIQAQGWLTKAGGRIKTHKKRFFLMHDNHLFYYENEDDVGKKQPRGSICIKADNIVDDMTTDAERTKGTFHFRLYQEGIRDWQFFCKDDMMMAQWVRVLNGAIRWMRVRKLPQSTCVLVLDCQSGPLVGERFVVYDRGVVIGRSKSCTLRIPGKDPNGDVSVSHQHTEIRFNREGGFFEVINLSVKNPTILTERGRDRYALRGNISLPLVEGCSIFVGIKSRFFVAYIHIPDTQDVRGNHHDPDLIRHAYERLQQQGERQMQQQPEMGYSPQGQFMQQPPPGRFDPMYGPPPGGPGGPPVGGMPRNGYGTQEYGSMAPGGSGVGPGQGFNGGPPPIHEQLRRATTHQMEYLPPPSGPPQGFPGGPYPPQHDFGSGPPGFHGGPGDRSQSMFAHGGPPGPGGPGGSMHRGSVPSLAPPTHQPLHPSHQRQGHPQQQYGSGQPPPGPGGYPPQGPPGHHHQGGRPPGHHNGYPQQHSPNGMHGASGPDLAGKAHQDLQELQAVMREL